MMTLPAEMYPEVLQYSNLLATINLISTCKQIRTFVFKENNEKEKLEQFLDFIIPMVEHDVNFINLFNDKLYSRVSNYFKEKDSSIYSKIVEQNQTRKTLESLLLKKDPLLTAMQLGTKESFSLLLKHSNNDPNLLDKRGNSFLHIAMYLEKKDFFELLLKDPNVDPNRVDSIGSSPIYTAVSLSKKDFFELLLKQPNVDFYKHWPYKKVFFVKLCATFPSWSLFQVNLILSVTYIMCIYLMCVSGLIFMNNMVGFVK